MLDAARRPRPPLHPLPHDGRGLRRRRAPTPGGFAATSLSFPPRLHSARALPLNEEQEASYPFFQAPSKRSIRGPCKKKIRERGCGGARQHGHCWHTLEAPRGAAAAGMEVYLASDAFGSDLRAAVRERLEAEDRVCRVIDLGEAAYYDAAAAVARAVAERRLARGVLVCGTGGGVCMVANKHPGVMAVLARDADDAAEARSISGANVLCLGQMRTSPDVAGACVDAFLGTGVGAPCRASGGGAWVGASCSRARGAPFSEELTHARAGRRRVKCRTQRSRDRRLYRAEHRRCERRGGLPTRGGPGDVLRVARGGRRRAL